MVIGLKAKRERLYQPFVEAENVRRLYRLKILTGKPMTTLINEAIQFYDEYVRTRLEKDGYQGIAKHEAERSISLT